MAEARSTSTTAPPLVRLPRPVSVQSLAQAGPSSHAGNLGNGTPRKSLALAAIAAATGQSVDRAASRASSAMSDVDRMEARSPSMASEVDQIMSSSIDTLSTNPTAPDVHAESSSQQLSKSQKKKFKAQERKRRHKEETRAGSQQTSHTLQRNQPQPQASTSKPTAVVENAAPSSSQRESSKVDSCTEWIQIPSKVQKAHQRKASQAHGHRQTPGAAAAALSTVRLSAVFLKFRADQRSSDSATP